MAVHTTARSFSLAVNRAAERMAEGGRKRMTKVVALRALEGVVFGTRVDTGRARGNWQVGESEPPTGHDPETMDPGGTVTLSEGNRKILAMEGDDVIWLHNGVPYIGVLEDKDKMVAGNVEALRTWLRSQR